MNKSDTVFIDRLKERGVEKGSGRHSTLQGRERSVFNQTNIGSVSRAAVVFLSCPLVKTHAVLSGSFLYSQSTMKDMYSKATNRTELSIPMKTKSIA